MKQFTAALVLVATFSCRVPGALAVSPEKVSFPSLEEGGPTVLIGYLYKPATGATLKPMSALVLAHGCSGMIDGNGKIRAGISFWAERFVEKGYVVLAVDSFNLRGYKEVCTEGDRPILESRERPRDAFGGLKYLTTQACVKKDQVFFMGFSNGATGTLYAVAAGGKPQQLAAEAGISFRAALAFYPGGSAANRRRLKFAIPRGVFIGADDDWTPPQPCSELVALNKSSGLDAVFFSYPGAYHRFDVPGSTVRVRTDVRMSAPPGLANGVHVGGNDAARLAATKEVDAFIEKHLK